MHIVRIGWVHPVLGSNWQQTTIGPWSRDHEVWSSCQASFAHFVCFTVLCSALLLCENDKYWPERKHAFPLSALVAGIDVKKTRQAWVETQQVGPKVSIIGQAKWYAWSWLLACVYSHATLWLQLFCRSGPLIIVWKKTVPQTISQCSRTVKLFSIIWHASLPCRCRQLEKFPLCAVRYRLVCFRMIVNRLQY